MNQKWTFRISVLATIFAGAGCASPAPQVKSGPTRAFAESQQSPKRRGPAPDPRIPAARVDGATGVVNLCDALRDEESINFSGNEVERARERERHATERQRATGGRYVVDVPADGYQFTGYDMRDRQLAIPGHHFTVGQGAQLYAADADEILTFDLGPDAAERIVRMQADGKLYLRLVFQPAPSAMRADLCMRLGGNIAKLAVDVLAGYLVGPQGAPLARYETQAFAQVMGVVTPVANPQVKVAEVMSASGSALQGNPAADAGGLEQSLLGCYSDTLMRNQGVRGRVVVRVEWGKDGQLRAPHMEVSSLGDDGLVTCALKTINGGKIPGATQSRDVFLTIDFGPGL